jgi:signal transduction histidine kinase
VSRLHTRIYVHSLGVLLVVAVATSALFVLGARGAFQREIAERMVRHVAALAGERFDDADALARRVRQLHADLGVDVTVRDLGGRLVAVAGSPLPALAPADAERVRAGQVVTRAGPAWSAASLVRDPVSGAPIGTVEAAVPRRFGLGRLLGPAAAVLAVLLVVAVATRPLARRLSRPVEELTAAARRLGQGDLRARVPSRARRRGHGRGIDELEALTGAFNEMADRVERIVRGQRELLANVSHELRSPLARIRVALELVSRTGDDGTRLAAVERDLADLDRLIADVLATARLDETGLPSHLGVVDVRALLTDLAARARHDPVVGGREVLVEEGPALSIVADEALLRRALWNLVENAATHGAPPIALSAVGDGDVVRLGVTDQGPGIPAAERARVLEPFVRLDRARTPTTGMTAGTGLGLTLARRVAEVHGGSIAVGAASTAGGRERGCRITLAIPIHGA